MRPDEKSKTAIIGFHKYDDAMFIGKMIETYFIRQKELPDTKEAGTLILPSSDQKYDVLHYLYIQEWKFDELKLMCTRNILDVVSVQDIVNSKGGYSFAGVVYKFEAPIEFYQARYDELFKAMTLNDCRTQCRLPKASRPARAYGFHLPKMAARLRITASALSDCQKM
jgi:hypothetical protein